MYCNCNGLKRYFLVVHSEISKLLSKTAKLATRFSPTGMLQSNTSGSVIPSQSYFHHQMNHLQCDYNHNFSAQVSLRVLREQKHRFKSHTNFFHQICCLTGVLRTPHFFCLWSLVWLNFTNTTCPLYRSGNARHKMMQQEANTSC